MVTKECLLFKPQRKTHSVIAPHFFMLSILCKKINSTPVTKDAYA